MAGYSNLLYPELRGAAPDYAEGLLDIVQRHLRVAVGQAVLEYYAGYAPVSVEHRVGISFGTVPDGTVTASGAYYDSHSVGVLGDEE